MVKVQYIAPKINVHSFLKNNRFDDFWAPFWQLLGTIWLHLGGLGGRWSWSPFSEGLGEWAWGPREAAKAEATKSGGGKGWFPGPITSVPEGYRTQDLKN